MILGFNKIFNKKILSGEKVHTIRIDKLGRWKPGNSIQFYNGVRTKNMTKFREDGICLSVQKIRIKLYSHGTIMVYIDENLPLLKDTCMNFIKRDGFDNGEDFCNWFFPGKRFGTFKGVLIHWTNLKY